MAAAELRPGAGLRETGPRARGGGAGVPGPGLTRTRERTGVLIYVAAAEHYAEIIADIGIADRAGRRSGAMSSTDLIEALRAGTPRMAWCDRGASAPILAEHAPPRFDDADELPNRVILISAGSCARR